MVISSDQNRRPLGLFVDQATPLLYTSLIETFRVRHYSPWTAEAYVHWIRRYLLYHQFKHPRLLKESDVNHFLTYLAVNETVSASTQNQALSAILFLYEHVLKQPLDRIDGVVRARRFGPQVPERQPRVAVAVCIPSRKSLAQPKDK